MTSLWYNKPHMWPINTHSVTLPYHKSNVTLWVFIGHSGTLENKHMCLFSNVPLWPINTHSVTLDLWYGNVTLWVFIGHSGTLDLWYGNVTLWVFIGHSVTLDLWYGNIHMCILSYHKLNIPLWVLVFATFVYDVSMVQQTTHVANKYSQCYITIP